MGSIEASKQRIKGVKGEREKKIKDIGNESWFLEDKVVK